MKVKPQMRNQGFNLVETLVASAILSGAVVTVGAISTNALTMTRLNRQYERAATIAEKQLRMIDYVGIDAITEAGTVAGDVEDFEPVYHWEVTTDYIEIDSVYLVTIVVSWADGNRPRSFMMQTMLDGTSTYLELGTDTTGGASLSQ